MSCVLAILYTFKSYRDTGLKNYHYTGNTYSSRMAVVISIDETCTCIKVKYCSLGPTLVVDRRNVLKADNVEKAVL